MCNPCDAVGMSRYRVGTPYVMWTYETVEAEDETSAVEAAEGIGGICAQCSGWGQEWDREIGDDPVFIEAGQAMTYAIEPYAEKIED